jgi:dihydropteroate synthase-like protein
MAKILIVTGILAEPIIRQVISKVKTTHKVDILVTPVSVAAFLTTRYIADYLRKLGVKASDYDYVLIPGLAMGSAKVIEDAIGVRALKGTVNAYDLTDILSMDSLDSLSPDVPADEILRDYREKAAERILLEIENKLNDENSLSINGLRVPLTPPPIRVAAEVTEAHELSVDQVIRRAEYYIDSGADIVVLGFEALNPHPDKVGELVRKVREWRDDVPLAVDSEIPSEIEAAVNSGADAIININLNNMDRINIDRDVAIVIIPEIPGARMIPQDPKARVELLVKAVDKARSRGFRRVMADAILDPFGSTFNSLMAYYEFKRVMPDVPMFMGIGNVTELIDADSVGVNASMVMLAQEIGVSVVFVVEKSQKAQGSVLETKVAAQMAALASYKRSPPKDLGISLLVLKDKRRVGSKVHERYNDVIYASSEKRNFRLDPLGFFRIWVDHENKCIEAMYIGKKGRILIRGRSAREIRYEIASRDLVSEISHALYLGEELAKAEMALLLNKSYVQEMPLFKLPRYIDIRGDER